VERIHFRNVSPAGALALIALFVALSGTSYAAVAKLLPRNTVGSAQVVNGSLQAVDLSSQARTSLKGQRGPAGPKGETGTTGAQGQQGLSRPGNR